MLYKLQSKKERFTFVELIVVIAILLVLISLLVPNIVGYIDSSTQAAVASEAKSIFTSAQSACALSRTSGTADASPTTFKTITTETETFTAGCVTNNTIAGVLENPTSIHTREEYIAHNLLEVMGNNVGNKNFSFISGTPEPYGQNVESYNTSTSQSGLIIAFNPKTGVHFVEWGRDGYLAHVDAGGHVLCEEGGTFASVS